jgi:hypothetical protein
VATLNKMGGKSVSVYYADGPFTITASHGAAKAAFQLSAAADPSKPTTASNVLKIVSGDKQSAQRTGTELPGGVATFGPLTVQVTDPAGKPLSGVRVSFICKQPAAMACQFTPAGGGGVTLTTDAAGNATLNQMGGKSARAYYASGKMPIVVSGDNTNQVTFDLTVLDAPPPPAPIAGATMTVVSGNGQKVPRTNTASGIAIAAFGPLQVAVKDSAGKPLPGVQITWSCAAPAQMACQTEPSGARPTLTTTDANGVATLNKMGGKSVSIYYADGPFTITASHGAAKAAFQLSAGQ